VEKSEFRPSGRTLVIVLVLMGVLVAAGVVSNQIVIATLATMLICGVVVAIWLLRGRR
jgi:hypothetical protein